MGLFSALKWIWDPRTEEDKIYDDWDKKTPLQIREQTLFVFIKDLKEPLVVTFSRKDWNGGFGTMRWASDKKTFDSLLAEWIGDRGHLGIHIDSVWYSPKNIERIELGDSELKPI